MEALNGGRMTLADAPTGAVTRIVLFATTVEDDLLRLAAAGFLPGAAIRVNRRLPTVCVEIDGACIALDAALAGSVIVEPKPPDAPTATKIPNCQPPTPNGGTW